MKSYQAVFDSIAPVWELDQFVAVNPFLGSVDRSFPVVLEQEELRTGHRHLPLPHGQPPVHESWQPDSLPAWVGPFLAGWLLSRDAGHAHQLYGRTPFWAAAAILVVALLCTLRLPSKPIKAKE